MFKNIRRFDVLGRHYQVRETVRMLYEYRKNNRVISLNPAVKQIRATSAK